VGIEGLRGTNGANTQPYSPDGSAAGVAFTPSPTTDTVPRLPRRPPQGHDDTHCSLAQLASLSLQSCRRIFSATGPNNVARQDPKLRRGALAHGAGHKLVGPFLLSKNGGGGFTFTERSGGPPGTKGDILSIRPDGGVSYSPGTRTQLDPSVDPAQAKDDAAYDMLEKFLRATNKYLATLPRSPGPRKIDPAIAENLVSGLRNRV
jgi:hypothetical protein